MALLSKKMMGFLYGMGAAVVIVGALFKLMHWPGAGPMLVIGLLTEALIFALSAFEPVEHELDWSLVYPELAGGEAKAKDKKENPADAQGLLSQKLDNMLKEAKIDGELMASLGNSIKNFEGAAKSISPTVDAMAGQKKYAEEMSTAAAQMEALNNLYKLQLDSASRNATANQEIADNAAKLKEQMQSMTSNIASLNAVYGGMLTAMSNR
ncbi:MULTISPECIES: type IX secretion system motor protein PorL/GldL [Flavobacterium]|jgi:gliding motility-associated protein GldL|uniref:Protein involved in gliding motility GldL n=2 Tax=Flavobacterium TaxID=237 RepID=A0A562KB07_9FLAO|nr:MULTISPECIES: gliding motility protein GldL [Flavobacterium]OGS61994.1 MAG: gliding motility protein GldL [Flavobacteria bacterium GWF1_32_7]TDR24023.1 protein involved in gliding motility GldL [Flavobacterium cheniae]TWH92587.1 protein involved in gliding motility GldL [Flavobacterium cheniae]HBD27143.1 gliding motility protein GldL [Flavobacterium sp.]